MIVIIQNLQQRLMPTDSDINESSREEWQRYCGGAKSTFKFWESKSTEDAAISLPSCVDRLFFCLSSLLY